MNYLDFIIIMSGMALVTSWLAFIPLWLIGLFLNQKFNGNAKVQWRFCRYFPLFLCIFQFRCRLRRHSPFQTLFC